MTREQIETAFITAPTGKGRASQWRRVYGIEDYLFIGADRMTGRQAAERLGVSQRTVWRWRKAIREAS